MAAKAKPVETPIEDIDLDDAPEPSTPEKPKKEKAPKAEKPPKEKKEKKEKKAKKEKDDTGEKKKGGALKIIIPIVLLLLVGGLAAVVILNPLGLRDRYLGGVIQRIPIVNNLIKADDAPPAMTIAEAQGQIDLLTKEADAKDTEIKRQDDTISALTAEVNRLKEFEAYQTQVKADKADFDAMVAKGDPAAYTKFFENIDPANAERLYKEIVGETVDTKELKSFVSTFAEMDESEAAAILELMAATNMNTVTTILKNLGADQRAAILGKMPPAVAARVVRMMSPA